MSKDLGQMLLEELEKQKQEVIKTNVMVAGGTGVGKSSLINQVFGKNIAKVGNGEPVTRGLDKYEFDEFPVIIYDTEGYEISSSKSGDVNFEEKIKPIIEEKNRGELKDNIHLVWYCISITNHRVTDYDLKNIKYFLDNNMKIAIVFTKCDADELLENGLGKEASEFKSVIREHFQDMVFFETSHDSEMKLDLNKLIEWSYDKLDNDTLQRSFISAQVGSLEMKKQEAYKVVKIYTGTVGASAGANLIPLSDSLVIAPQQVAMMVQLASIFNFDLMGETLQSLVKSQLLSMAGRQMVASLTKFIPVVGQVINVAVASGLTYALGSATVEIYAKAYSDYLQNGKLPVWAEIFSSSMFMQLLENNMKSWQQDEK